MILLYKTHSCAKVSHYIVNSTHSNSCVAHVSSELYFKTPLKLCTQPFPLYFLYQFSRKIWHMNYQNTCTQDHWLFDFLFLSITLALLPECESYILKLTTLAPLLQRSCFSTSDNLENSGFQSANNFGERKIYSCPANKGVLTCLNS